MWSLGQLLYPILSSKYVFQISYFDDILSNNIFDFDDTIGPPSFHYIYPDKVDIPPSPPHPSSSIKKWPDSDRGNLVSEWFGCGGGGGGGGMRLR